MPRLLMAAPAGGSGKTLLSLGLARALREAGVRVCPCKKGPDYIDAAWLSLAAGAACVNLDPYFLDAPQLRALAQHAWRQQVGGTASADLPQALLLVEGNRGLFDGRDIHGSCSSAALARVLAAPVVLVLDITKMTRTAAALVQGLAAFDPDLRLGGVLLNHCASARHEALVRQSIETSTNIPVLGALPRLRRNPLPERHMGLVAPPLDTITSAGAITRAITETGAHARWERILSALARHVRAHVDVPRLLALARSAPDIPEEPPFWEHLPASQCGAPARPLSAARQIDTVAAPHEPRIGYVFDDALWFYYPENLEALERAGAKLLRLSLLAPAPWPADLDGLYLGGGFPEEWGERLGNLAHLSAIRALAAAGMPVYAECGGFVLLAESLCRGRRTYPMSGVLPVRVRFHRKPQGLGYVDAEVVGANPFHPVGTQLRGHEFHYSRCEATAQTLGTCALRLHSGTGMGKDASGHHVDGLCSGRVFASYTHIFAPSVPRWAGNMVAAARQYARERAAGQSQCPSEPRQSPCAARPRPTSCREP